MSLSRPSSQRFDVLVVDDDDDVRDLIVSYCERSGMPVTALQDGAAAIGLLERSNGRYGLVITDLNLPGADGFAVLHAAKQANASCYVVIVTGYASIDSAILAVRVGAYDYLSKPFSIGQLDVILKRVADRVSLERENRDLAHHPAPGPASPAQPSSSPSPAARAYAGALYPPPVPLSAHSSSGVVQPSLESRIAALEELVARLEGRVEGPGAAAAAVHTIATV